MVFPQKLLENDSVHIFIHLLNDFSGSPRIINEKISCYSQLGGDCFIITNGRGGFIRTDNIKHQIISYEKHSNIAIWAFRLLIWHFRTFFFVICLAKRSDVVHCSTLLTAPHLLAARLKGAKTVCHAMETTISPPLHKYILFAFVRLLAHKVVYLSAYVETALGPQLRNPDHCVTYPCIDQKILDAANIHVSV